jgi:hypothetical protein
MRRKRKGAQTPVKRRFGSGKDVENLTGISARTLQDDRRLGRDRFPFYKIRGRFLYDLQEVEKIIRRSRRGEPTEVR